jgi:hypothetical protein
LELVPGEITEATIKGVLYFYETSQPVSSTTKGKAMLRSFSFEYGMFSIPLLIPFSFD